MNLIKNLVKLNDHKNLNILELYIDKGSEMLEGG